MFFLKPVNISSVTRCKYLAVSSLATFWISVFMFFFASGWMFLLFIAAHAVSLYLLVSHAYRLLSFIVLSLGGEGAVPGAANSAPAHAPDHQLRLSLLSCFIVLGVSWGV